MPTPKNHIITSHSWSIKKLFKRIVSIFLFYPGFWYRAWKYGSSFTFNQIGNDTFSQSPLCAQSICIALSPETHLLSAIQDGRSTPLVLGSIPRSQHHIQILKAAFNLAPSDTITLFTLNRSNEIQWSGLKTLLRKDPTLYMHRYPTTDFYPPSLIDFIRIVLDLDNRDSLNTKLVYLHCTAGGGRSVAAAAAYFLYRIVKAGIELQNPIEQIEAYLAIHRHEYDINTDHYAGLVQFYEFLIETKDNNQLNSIAELYAPQIQHRIKQISSI